MFAVGGRIRFKSLSSLVALTMRCCAFFRVGARAHVPLASLPCVQDTALLSGLKILLRFWCRCGQFGKSPSWCLAARSAVISPHASFLFPPLSASRVCSTTLLFIRLCPSLVGYSPTRSQVKVNVIDPRHQQQQQERLRLLAAAGETPEDLSDPDAAAAAAGTAHALVPSHANSEMKLGKLDIDIDMDMDGGVYFGSAGNGREALGGGGDASGRPRRRGPSPIHRAVNAGEEVLPCLPSEDVYVCFSLWAGWVIDEKETKTHAGWCFFF